MKHQENKIDFTDSEKACILEIVRELGGQNKVELRRELEKFGMLIRNNTKKKIRYKFNQSMKNFK